MGVYDIDDDAKVGVVSSKVSAIVCRDDDGFYLMRIALFKDGCSPNTDYMRWSDDPNVRFLVSVGGALESDNAIVAIRENNDVNDDFRAYSIKPDGSAVIWGRVDGVKMQHITIPCERFFEKFESMDFESLYSVEEMTSQKNK